MVNLLRIVLFCVGEMVYWMSRQHQTNGEVLPSNNPNILGILVIYKISDRLQLTIAGAQSRPTGGERDFS